MLKFGVVLALLGVLVLAVEPVCFAEVPGPVMKLTNGLSNVITGVVEVPKQMVDTFQKDKNGFEALTTGLLKGVIYGIGRTLAGAVDTVFFLVPPYDHPLVEPLCKLG